MIQFNTYPTQYLTLTSMDGSLDEDTSKLNESSKFSKVLTNGALNIY